MGKFKCGQKVVINDASSAFYNQEAYITDTVDQYSNSNPYGGYYRISLDGGVGRWFAQDFIPCVSIETITDKEILDIIGTSDSAS